MKRESSDVFDLIVTIMMGLLQIVYTCSNDGNSVNQ